MAITTIRILILTLLTFLVAILKQPLSHRYELFGFGRALHPASNIHGSDLRKLPKTPHTEDLHYHAPSGLLFGASESDTACRWSWFPPNEALDSSKGCHHGQGTFVVVDPKTFEVTRLTLRGYLGAFVTHGIDIYSPPGAPDTVYIFAVNHLKNPAHNHSRSTEPVARSRVELFRHTVGDQYAEHIRSIWHPLIRTPNDVLAISENEFWVTNDHLYLSGPMRLLEDILLSGAPWTDLVHVAISSQKSANDSKSVEASVAIQELQNNNGLGRGWQEDEILVGRAVAGVLSVLRPKSANARELELVEEVQLGSCVDNPTYFHDPFASKTGRDASGYVMAGLATGFTWPNRERNPVIVWLLRPEAEEDGERRWKQTIIFRDDGKTISSGSTGVITAIDPEKNAGKKEGWLWVTGPVSEAVVVSRIPL